MDDRPRQDQACPAEPRAARPNGVSPDQGSGERAAVTSQLVVGRGDAGSAASAASIDTPLEGVLQTLLQNLDEAMVFVDPNGRVILLNDSAARLFGPAARQTPLDQWPTAFGICRPETKEPLEPDELPISLALRGRVISDAEVFVRNAQVPHGVWLRVGAQAVVDSSGEPCGAAWILRDMTRRRRVEQALAEERQLLERQSRRQSALADIELAVNTPVELADVLDQVVGLTAHHLPSDAACVVRWRPEDSSLHCAASTLEAPGFLSAPWETLTDGGATKWIVEHDQPLTVSDIRDDPFQVAQLFEDAAPRSYAGVPLTDEERVVGVLYALDRHPRRYTQDDLDFLSAIARRASSALTKVRLYDQLRDLNRTLRRRTAEVQENELRFRTMADNAPVLIWMTGPDGAPSYFNRTWLDFTGRDLDDQVEVGWSADLHPDDRGRAIAAWENAIVSRQPFTMDYRRRNASGQDRWLTDTGTPRVTPEGEFVGFIGSCTDITVRKEAEEKLRRHHEHLETVVTARTAELKSSLERLRVADRLATIGTLTAGLGHDMNNLLFPLRCRLDAVDQQSVPAELADTLGAVRHTIDYLQQLTDGMRLFARDPDDAGPAGAVTRLDEWWEQVRSLLTKTNHDSIRLVWDLPEDLPPVRVAPHRLTQAVLNMVINASEAMAGGGMVRFAARASDDGRTVRISVSDEGQGMSDEVRLRAFDPFFTTKTRTLSTGLGLSLVHGVVKSAGGSIDVDSQIGRGTTIVLSLPAALPDAAADLAAGRPRPRRAAVMSVADPRRQAWVVQCLEAAGFDVVRPGANDDAALSVLDATPENLPVAQRFITGRPDRRVIGIGAAAAGWRACGAEVVDDNATLHALQAAVEMAAGAGAGDDP